MSAWDARAWVATLMGVSQSDLTVRSIDRNGPSETQVRYERGGVAVARVTITGPMRPMFTPEGHGHWEVKAQIGPGTGDIHLTELPEADEIIY